MQPSHPPAYPPNRPSRLPVHRPQKCISELRRTQQWVADLVQFIAPGEAGFNPNTTHACAPAEAPPL